MKKTAYLIAFIIIIATGSHPASAQYDVNTDGNKIVVADSEGRQVVNISSDAQKKDRMSVEIAGFQIQLKANEETGIPEEKFVRTPKLNKGHLAFFEFGVINFHDSDYYMYDEADHGFMNLRMWNSFHIALTMAKLSFDLDRNGNVSFTTGAQWVANWYAISKNISVIKENGMIKPVYSDTPFRVSNIYSVSLQIPLIIETNFEKDFFMSWGMYIGIANSAVAQTRSPKTSVRNLYVNPFYAGLSIRWGWRGYYFLVSQHFTQLFRHEMGPMVSPTTFGIGIDF